MPCRPGKARRLLKENKATVIQRTPFTIQLNYSTGETKQDVSMGVDAGSKTIGVSCTTKKEELISLEMDLRGNDIVKLLSDKRQYRRGRRGRKTRYRKARFLNRVSRKKKGWLAPSIENKINAHFRIIQMLHNILPIHKIVAEVASFDIQKIKNPDIEGEDYQKGEQLGFWNIREYVLFRDNHTCQYCKGKSNDKILNVHHLESRKTGGDSPGNLITLCNTCHDKIHRENKELNIKKGESFKHASFMGIMRWAFYNRLKEIYNNVKLTYGYITKNERISNNLPKGHRIDGRCISGNSNAVPVTYYFFIKQVRKHNRQIHKAKILKGGRRKLNQANYLMHGFRLFDKVEYNNQECFIFGRRKSGYYDLRKLDGTVIHRSASYKKLKLLGKRKSMLWEMRHAV